MARWSMAVKSPVHCWPRTNASARVSTAPGRVSVLSFPTKPVSLNYPASWMAMLPRNATQCASESFMEIWNAPSASSPGPVGS